MFLKTSSGLPTPSEIILCALIQSDSSIEILYLKLLVCEKLMILLNFDKNRQFFITRVVLLFSIRS